jgi:hypothetical protein
MPEHQLRAHRHDSGLTRSIASLWTNRQERARGHIFFTAAETQPVQ